MIQPLLGVESDDILLREILSNLLSNAVEASSQGGEIIISAGADRDHLTLAVEDQGEGVPERLRRSIFLPFFLNKIAGNRARAGDRTETRRTAGRRDQARIFAGIARGTLCCAPAASDPFGKWVIHMHILIVDDEKNSPLWNRGEHLSRVGRLTKPET